MNANLKKKPTALAASQREIIRGHTKHLPRSVQWRKGAFLSLLALVSVTTFIMQLPSTARADSISQSDLLRRIEALEKQVQNADQIRKELEDLKLEMKKANETPPPTNPPVASSNQLIKFHVNGSVVADFVYSDAPGTHSSFGGGKFLPIFLAQYNDWLLFEGHVELTSTSDGGTDTSLEYAQLDFLVNDYLTIVAGKFLTPVGQFQQAIHPPWINKLPDRPAGFVEDGGDEPLSDVGIMARGGFPIGSLKGTYALYVGNGPQMGADGPMLKGFGSDDNSDKAVGGRLSIFPIPHLEIGLSGMRAKILGMAAITGSVTQAQYQMVGADFAYTKGYWDVRGEWIHSRLGAISSALDPTDPTPTNIPATTWNNWYVQAAYRMAGLTDNPILGKLEPVIQYGQYDVSGFAPFTSSSENRWSAGLDYWFAPSVVAKVAYENRDHPHGTNDNLVHAQVAFGF